MFVDYQENPLQGEREREREREREKALSLPLKKGEDFSKLI